MDSDPPSSTPRKVKFAPKGPPRRTAKSITTKIEKTVAEDDSGDDEAEQQALLRRIHDLGRHRPKVEKKSSVQVAFTDGVASTAIRTFGKQRERSNDGREAVDTKEPALNDMQIMFTSPSTAGTEVGETSTDSTDALIVKKRREYKEPWDYHHSNYPVTLPLRRPYSGDPELLDKAEFEKDVEYDENTLCSAKDLGLLDQDDASKMLLFQFPPNLPLDRQTTSANRRETADNFKVVEKSVTIGSSFPSGVFSASAKEKEMAGSNPSVSSISSDAKGKGIAGTFRNPGIGYASRKEFSLKELPEGYMGKMLIYKSGTVKLKLGDIKYDVSPGSDCIFAQNVVSINTNDRHCCELGELTKRAVVSPDVDSLLDHVINLG